MKTRCPACGATSSLDVLLAHEDASRALAAVFKLSGTLGSAVVRYLGLFRPVQRDLTMDRVAKLLNELLPDLQAQRITRNGQMFDAPPEAWVWSIEQALTARDVGRLKLPLKNHGWLYEVMSGWRPAAGNVTALAPLAPNKPSTTSKTLKGIAALEERIRG